MRLWFARLVFVLSTGFITSVQAATVNISPTDDLQSILDNSQSGDRVVLAPGLYQGNFIINKTVELMGVDGAVLDGQNKGHALQINTANAYIHHLRIQNWGTDLTDLDSGIFVSRDAANTRIKNNDMQGGGSGIWVDAAPNVHISSNKIEGDLSLRSSDRGNGIHLYNVTGALVQDNEVWHARDGIYIDTSNNNRLIGNHYTICVTVCTICTPTTTWFKVTLRRIPAPVMP